MAPADPKNSNTRQAPRVPLETKVHLEFEKFSGFITEFSSNISEGGLFIKTKTPKPLGTVVSFEFKLSDNFKLIQGMGEVVWARTEDLSEERPAGMGIRFVEVDQQSRELIATMVHNYVKRGGEPFQIEGADQAPPAIADTPLEAPPATAEPTLDPRDLFGTTEDASEPSATPPPEADRSLDLSSSPVEADFQALFESSDEPISTPTPVSKPQDKAPGIPLTPAAKAPPPPKPAPPPKPPTPPRAATPPKPEAPSPPKKPPHGNQVIDLGSVIDDEKISGPSTSIPIVDLLEPERPTRKPKPIVRQRKPMKINTPVGVILAVAIGAGSAFYFQSQITGLILGVKEPADQKQKTSRSATPAAKPTESAHVTPQATAATPPVAAAKPEPTVQPAVMLTPPSAPQSTPQPTPPPTAAPTAAPTTAPATPQPAPPATASEALKTFGSIQNIAWERTAHELVLILSADGVIPPGNFTHTRVTEGAPREVIKIVGVRKAFPKARIQVNTPEVRQIRIGFHASPTGNELHIVADLGDPTVRITQVEPDGRNLRVHLGK